ncbi:MAG: MraY family glycosyltransferase [Candidatus Latescibacterota bacterium]
MTSLVPWPLFAACAFGLTLLFVPLVRRLAWRVELVDRPRDALHKSHQRPVPYGGGVAIYLGAVLPAACLMWTPLGQAAADVRCVASLLGCATVVLAVGLADDWRPLPPMPRFAVQLLAAVLLLSVCPEFRLQILAADALTSALVTALWMVALTNAFNFLDNMDGLAGGIAAIALALLAAMGGGPPDAVLLVVSLALLGAVSAFLVYNFPPATIFMGDAGGFFIGFVVSSLSVLVSNRLGQVQAGFVHGLAPLLVLAVPVYDQIGVTLIRMRNGVPPWVGDKNHISHRLVALGLSRRTAVLVIHAATLATGATALLIATTPTQLAWGLSFLFGVVAAAVACLDAAARRRQHAPA